MVGCLDEVGDIYTRGAQSLFEVIALAIATDYAQGIDMSNAEGAEVGGDGAGCAGLVANGDYLMRFKAGFDGCFGEVGIRDEIAVEEVVTDDEDGEVLEFREDVVQGFEGHKYGGITFRDVV